MACKLTLDWWIVSEADAFCTCGVTVRAHGTEAEVAAWIAEHDRGYL